jgi:hypothetical protein
MKTMRNLGAGKPGAAALAMGLALAGCAGSSADFPSFAIPTSPAEGNRLSMRFPGISAPEPADASALAPPLPADLDAAIAAIAARADGARADFTAAQIVTSRRVSAARGAGVASDRWAAAEVSLADLASLHSNAALALADLDLLAAQATTNLAPPGEIASIAEAQARVERFVEEQTQTLAALNAAMER